MKTKMTMVLTEVKALWAAFVVATKARWVTFNEKLSKKIGSDAESMVYDPPRAKRVVRFAYVKLLVVTALWLGFLWIPSEWADLLMIPVAGMAISGAALVRDRALAFRAGWFSGQMDMAETLGNKEDLIEAVRLQKLRMTFVAEGLGIDRPSFEDDES